MQKTFFIIVLIAKSLIAFGQEDTLLVQDLTSALVYVHEDESLQLVFDKSDHRSVGLFIDRYPSQQIRLCISYAVSLWVEGRLLKKMDSGCEIFWSDDLFEFSDKDNNYVSLYSENGFEGLTIDIIDTQVKQVDHTSFEVRSIRNYFREFVIIVTIILIATLGFLAIRFQNRIKYLLSKSFSLKGSSYELADIRLFSAVGISFSLFLSVLMGFFWVYFQFELTNEVNLLSLGARWLNASGSILILLLFKWLLSLILSRLFSFGRIHEYQIFDLINISLSFCFLLLALFVVDFVFEWRINNWLDHGINIFISVVLAFIILFLGFKFVNNYPHKKLLIISYLCATEIIPAIILIGWFYK